MTDSKPRHSAQAPIFREFDHTGDLGIEIEAPTRDELFRRAAIALASVLVEIKTVAELSQRQLVVESNSDSDLLHDLLSQLLHLFIVDGFIWRGAVVDQLNHSLVITVRGEPFDERRHNFRGELKAVTYHQLAVEPTTLGWRARVIFDV